MKITKEASSSSFQKFITLKSRAGTAYLETDTYTKKWNARFKLASGFTAENIEWALTLINEAKTILNDPENAWQKIVNDRTQK